MTRRAIISQSHFLHNLDYVRQRVGQKKILAYIKSYAYGHGYEAIVPCVQDCDMVAVATMAEAMQVRKCGYHGPVLIQSDYLTDQDVVFAAQNGFVPLVDSMEKWNQLNAMSIKGVRWLKVNTGMNRLGMSVAQVHACLHDSDQEVVVMTHMAHGSDHPSTHRAMSLMHELKDARAVEICYAPSSLLCSDLDISQSDWVAPGLCLYGVGHPSLKCVMQLQAQVIAHRFVEAGMAIGYRGTYDVRKPTRTHILGIGYGDGLPVHMRDYENSQIAQVCGEVSMDMMQVILKDDHEVGSWIDIFSNQQDLIELSRSSGEMVYAILARLGSRVQRLPMPSYGQVVYQCRRGLLELDQCLSTFVTSHYQSCTLSEKVIFQQLLQCQDPELQHYFFMADEKDMDPALCQLIKKIKTCVSESQR